MDLLINPVLGLTCRLLVVLVFGSTAVSKVRDVSGFSDVLENYRIFPLWSVPFVGLLAIASESFIALAIWWPSLRPMVGLFGVALLAAYTFAIALNLWRGRRDIDCGCSFGRTGEPLSWALPVRNALLAVTCTMAALPQSGEISGLGWAVALLAATAFGVGYLVWGTLLANRPQLLRLKIS